MKFNQNKEDGSCDLEFNEEEIKIINNKKKVHFSAEALNLFGNCLMKMVMDWNANFNPDLQKKLNSGTEKELTLKKNDKDRK